MKRETWTVLCVFICHQQTNISNQWNQTFKQECTYETFQRFLSLSEQRYWRTIHQAFTASFCREWSSDRGRTWDSSSLQVSSLTNERLKVVIGVIIVLMKMSMDSSPQSRRNMFQHYDYSSNWNWSRTGTYRSSSMAFQASWSFYSTSPLICLLSTSHSKFSNHDRRIMKVVTGRKSGNTPN